MIKKYTFVLNSNSHQGKRFTVNKHNVMSGVFTMLYYKVLTGDEYKQNFRQMIDFQSGDYYNKTTTTEFERIE